MRIAHIVTAITPDGSYGGPLQVALTQVQGLIDRGHEAVLVGGARGFDGPLPTNFHGVPANLYSACRLAGSRYAGWLAPGLVHWLRREARGFDAFHVHIARDLCTAPIAWMLIRSGKTVVLQPHGMITPSRRTAVVAYDRLVTREALRRASSVAVLSADEGLAIRQIQEEASNVQLLPNALTPPPLEVPWSHKNKEVLFVGRLHAVKRPLQFARMAARLIEEFPEYSFTLIGPDEGEGGAVESYLAKIGNERIKWVGAMEAQSVRKRIARSQLVVSTSERESFGLVLVESSQVGTAVVLPGGLAISPLYESTRAGAVFDGTTDHLVDVVRGMLSAPARMESGGRNGSRMVDENFRLDDVLDKLVGMYRGFSVKP